MRAYVKNNVNSKTFITQGEVIDENEQNVRPNEDKSNDNQIVDKENQQ